MTDYEAERARFRLEVPARFNFTLDVLERRAAAQPDGLALLSLDAGGAVSARQTWSELATETRRMAHALTALGIGKGDPIFVMLPRIPEWYTVVLGAIRIGAIPMPGTSLLTGKDIAHRIERAGAVAAFTDPDGAARVDSVRDTLETLRHTVVVGEAPSDRWAQLADLLEPASTDPTPADPTAADDAMLLYFTSGTVSYPKMVMHTQASYGLGHTITARYWQDLREGDVHWTISDMGWAKAAWGKLFGQFIQGATVVQMNMGKPDADLILDTIGRTGITTFCAPPTLYRLLVQANIAAHDLSGLRHCVSAGEPLNPEVIRVWEEGTGGLTVYDGYGQTETCNLVANYRCMPVRPGSMGKPTPGYDVQVVDEGGNPVPAGEEGHIAVRVAAASQGDTPGPPARPVGIFNGYWKDDEATAAAFSGGWYFTGDKARVDEDGYLWFEGRSDDVITSSAYRIGPFEVESAIVEHPAVAEAAVVGKDDPERTQLVTAFCILAPGYEPSDELAREIQDHVKQSTAPYKYPRLVYFVDELPKTVSGKIRRTELRDRLREQG
ncbi:MAG TPA: AMP-binding protein [Acidimicrobiia bacterium]|nr:AMP-binding protein [Acidimicrobiia bacterium]